MACNSCNSVLLSYLLLLHEEFPVRFRSVWVFCFVQRYPVSCSARITCLKKITKVNLLML